MGRIVGAIAGGVTVVLVAFDSGYGYHRDELYFVAAGRHLDWAYADQGPVTPLIARAMSEIAPSSLTMLRLPAALAAAVTVLLTGLLARELGGGRRAQSIAAACAAVATIVLFTGHLLNTSTFDLLVWTAVTWLAVRAVRRDDDRLWLVAGVVLGIGLLNKPLPAFLVVGLLAGVVLAGPRRLLGNPYVWSGAAIALVLWSPWIVWQAEHGWPQIDVSRSIAAGGSTSSEPWWAIVPFQLLLVSPPLAPVWIAGLVSLFRDPPARRAIRRVGLGGARRRLHGDRRQAVLPGRAARRSDRRRGGAGRRLARARPDADAQGGARRSGRRQWSGGTGHRAACAARRRPRPGDRGQRGRRRDHRLAGARPDRGGRRARTAERRTPGVARSQLRGGGRDRPLRPRPRGCHAPTAGTTPTATGGRRPTTAHRSWPSDCVLARSRRIYASAGWRPGSSTAPPSTTRSRAGP